MSIESGDMQVLFRLQASIKEVQALVQKLQDQVTEAEERKRKATSSLRAATSLKSNMEEGLSSIILGRPYTYTFVPYYPSGTDEKYRRVVSNLTELEVAIDEDLKYAENVWAEKTS